MTEIISQLPPQIVHEAADNNVRRGVSEAHLTEHLAEYDDFVGAAHAFVGGELGMSDTPESTARTVVLSSHDAVRQSGDTRGGSYNALLDIARVIEPSESERMQRPKTAKIQLAAGLVHEVTHAASVTPEVIDNTHSFYYEGIAGLAEFLALKNLADAGEYTPPPNFTVTRVIDDQEVRIVVPGAFRRVDANETIEGQADTSQALIAALIMGIAFKRTGISARDMLSNVRKGDRKTYDQLQVMIESIEPGFGQFIESQPKTTDGVIKIAERAQRVTGMTAFAS